MSTTTYRPLHGQNVTDAAVWQIAEGRETLTNVLAERAASADRLSMDPETSTRSAARSYGRSTAYDNAANMTARTADALVARLVKCGDNANSEEAADAFERAARIVAEMLGTTAAPAGRIG